jgi:hypothetical protein
VEVELVQVLEGRRSFHQDWLKEHGEGVNHLGFDVDDYDRVHGSMIDRGFEPIMWIDTDYPAYPNGRARACYFDTRPVGGIIFEVMWRSWAREAK